MPDEPDPAPEPESTPEPETEPETTAPVTPTPVAPADTGYTPSGVPTFESTVAPHGDSLPEPAIVPVRFR